MPLTTDVNNPGFATGGPRFARIGGSSCTTFQWNGAILAFARQISVQSPTPVAQTTPIHPMNWQRPVELVTPLAATMGSLQLELYEVFGEKVWDRIVTLSGHLDNIVDIFNAVANLTDADSIKITKVISPQGKRGRELREEYHNCVVSSVDDSETIEVGTMEVLKRMTLNFTHSTWSVQ